MSVTFSHCGKKPGKSHISEKGLFRLTVGEYMAGRHGVWPCSIQTQETERGEGMFNSLSSFYSVQESSPWVGASHIQDGADGSPQ